MAENPSLQRNFTLPTNPALRIGAVTYLNSKPLIENLLPLLSDSPFPGAQLQLDYPSRLADGLKTGQLDVALVPSIEYFRLAAQQPCRIVSNACVATHGPVRSVKLYTRVPWEQIQTLALDEGSRTSATLARILLHQRYGKQPEITSFPLGSSLSETNADAILMIGDRAMFPVSDSIYDAWDLGEEWLRQTDLPFVFAMWVASGPILDEQALAVNPPASEAHEPLQSLANILAFARDLGVAHAEQIASREAPPMNLSIAETVQYFTENLYFHLGSAERRGLELYYQLASQLKLAPPGVRCEFCDPIPAR